ncbi:acetylornithine deacetylase [Pararhizobium haloflavum]|uniref:acetylornithine deacetylase n=1 Tax=Pararhizobium haloflavum TaxID=2037914 RepID=UPI0018E42029|nr:acetylornithine deacetylase [Pararhizobium haloflavum]
MMLLSRTKDLLADLIAYPTVSADSNLELIAYAADVLERSGAQVRFYGDESGRKANLFATIGPQRDGGIVLSGHSDVVPTEGQEWTSDPFAVREADGLLYGRGSCDMKGFIAACLAVAPVFAARELSRPIHFAFTYDEEVGCLGARALMTDLAAAGIRPSAVIIGEPTEMRIIEGHKGCYEYTTHVTGTGGHASVPDAGVNAIEYAVRYITRLLDLRDPLKARAPEASPFNPPWTTVQAGAVVGGPARNVIASDCRIDWEMRPVTSADADYVKAEMHAYVEDVLKPAMHRIAPETEIVTHVVGEVEGLEPVSQSEALAIARELTGRNDTDVVSFGTEAGLFQKAGISAVVCGPGSIAQAHKPDEFISEDQLVQCLGMLERLADKVSAP